MDDGPTDSAVLLWLEESLSALAAHDKECGSRESTRVEVVHSNTPEGLKLVVWWLDVPSALGHRFAWDKTLLADTLGEALEDARKRLPATLLGHPVSWREEAYVAKAGRPEPPLYQYHPQRVSTLLPFAKAMTRASMSEAGVTTLEDLQRIAGAFFGGIQESSRANPEQTIRERIRGGAVDMRAIAHAIGGYQAFTAYHKAGKHIFDIPPLLAEMFANTDVDDIPVELVKLPYPAQYVHFGSQPDMAIRPGWHLDGAYVQQFIDGSISICVTAKPPTVEAFLDYGTLPEPLYQQTLPAALAKMSLGEAVDTALSEKIAQLRKDCTEEGAGAEEAEVFLESGGRVRSRRGKASAQELALLSGKHTAYQSMLRLVVNALCYITAYPEDTTPQWPSTTPEKLLKKLQEGTSVQRRNAQTKLQALGFTPIHLCGARLGEELRKGGAHPSDLSTEQRKGHTWRRGHYLRQVHGPQRSLRKLQWRMPVLVRLRIEPDAESAPPGHIYLVT